MHICKKMFFSTLIISLFACANKTSYNPIDVSGNNVSSSDIILSPEEIPNSSSSTSSTESSDSWIPDIEDSDSSFEIPDFDDSTKYPYDNDHISYEIANGNATNDSNIFTSLNENTLIVSSNTSSIFPYGTFEATITKNSFDTGLVFGLSSNQNKFWEGINVSYYFFFLSKDNTAYLGKTDNGQWSALQVNNYNYSINDTYTIRIIYQSNKICCYIDNNLVVAYRDNNKLTGARFGFRSGGSNVTFSDIYLTNDYLYI